VSSFILFIFLETDVDDCNDPDDLFDDVDDGDGVVATVEDAGLADDARFFKRILVGWDIGVVYPRLVDTTLVVVLSFLGMVRRGRC
jgi:hypothetical protein